MAKKEKDDMQDKEVKAEGTGFVEVPDIPMPENFESDKELIQDECKGAFNWAFVGAGQAGARMVESFYKLGYRRVCAINTTNQDLAAIQIPEANKLVMDIGEGGAGKNPEQGAKAIKQYYEDVYDLMRRSFGSTFERIIVCIGAGGGTGSGSVDALINIAHDIAQSFKAESAGDKPAVGALVSMPMNSEGPKVNANAYKVLETIFGMVGEHSGKLANRTLSPLIIVDNERISKIYPGLPVAKFWGVANQSISSLFHLFNSVAVQDSEYTTFDRADLKDILQGGVLTFGATPLGKYDNATDISFAIRDNLKKNILVGGLDLRQAKKAGCVFIASPDVLDSIPQEYLEHGFEMLSRIMKEQSVVHRGIYKGSRKGIAVYTIIGELGKPEDRMAEIARLGGIQVQPRR